MDNKSYLEQSERTCKKFDEGKHFDATMMDLLHAQMGLSSEAGEFSDQLKRHIFYGTPLDLVNLEEEIGDLLWYLALGLRATGSDFGNAMYMNIEKLKARFPDKFKESDAVIRDLDVERNILESGSTNES